MKVKFYKIFNTETMSDVCLPVATVEYLLKTKNSHLYRLSSREIYYLENNKYVSENDILERTQRMRAESGKAKASAEKIADVVKESIQNKANKNEKLVNI